MKHEEPTLNPQITKVYIEDELKTSYLDYAMSVIVGRALPDVRDGLKPVHRRVLFAMYDLGNTYQKPYKKSARVVGDVIGKYHPHGSAPVYEAIVRLVQDFSMRYPLVDGQGNFGSVDGDVAADMRYTEVRMAQITQELLQDLDAETVDFLPNYDSSTEEPTLLPTRLPNLLINGSTGIAVGMATSIPPHNLSEVMKALLHLIDHPDASSEELLQFVQAPDFPTGGLLFVAEGVRQAYLTGKGFVTVRAQMEVENLKNDRQQIIVTELPYQVNKAKLIEKIADLVKDKKIEGISDLRDESDRTGMRIVIEVKRSENPHVLMKTLLKLTPLQDNYSIHFLAIHQGKPKTLTLRDLLTAFLEHRKTVVIRRTQFYLKKAKARAHILEGFQIIAPIMDQVIALIRAARSSADAKSGLMQSFSLSALQCEAILELKLARLTSLEQQKIHSEYQELLGSIQYLEGILGNSVLLLKEIRAEFEHILEKYGDVRRSKLMLDGTTEFHAEDLITNQETLISITHAGYIKRTDPAQFKAQHRGGKGIMTANSRSTDEDVVIAMYQAHTLSTLLCFSDRGRVYPLKVYKIPSAARTAKGKAIINLIPLLEGEKIKALIPLEEFKPQDHIVTVTAQGIIKKTSVAEFANIRISGATGVKTSEDDALVDAKLVRENQEVFLCSREGMGIRFSESELRSLSRSTRGVIGMNLSDTDAVVSLELLDQASEAGPAKSLFTVTEGGYGKRTDLSEYRLQSRGGAGTTNIKIAEKNAGGVVGARQVLDQDQVVLISSRGKIIRLKVSAIRPLGRATQGVRLISLAPGEKLVAFELVSAAEDVLEPEEQQDTQET